MNLIEIIDGFASTTTSLESTARSSRVVKYIPELPGVNDAGQYQDVTETVEVQFKNQATAESDMRTLNLAFANARMKARQPFRLQSVVFKVQFTASSPLVESPILNGAARFTKFTPGEQILEVVFTRRYYFQDVTETALPCGGTTSGLTVYNYTNGGNSNHFLLSTSVLGGDLPVPVRWEVQVNTIGAGEIVEHLRLGAFRSISGSFPLMFEGESGTLHPSGSGSNQVVSGTSGGSVKRTSVISFIDQAGAIPLTSYNILNWTVSAADASAINGRSVRPVVRVSGTPPADVQMWVQSSTASSAYASIGDYVSLNTSSDAGNIIEFPAIEVPPRSVLSTGADTAAPVTLSLYARKMSTAAANIDIDFLQLMPTDGWRKIIANCATGLTIHDDPYNGFQFTRTGGGQRTGIPAYGAPVEVMPNETVYVTLSTRTTAPTVLFSTRNLTVKAYAKSRRLSL
jgi:hypothetical protein